MKVNRIRLKLGLINNKRKRITKILISVNSEYFPVFPSADDMQPCKVNIDAKNF